MDRSTLEKLILEKLPLPDDFRQAIKGFLPLNPATPTALLMKAVEIEYWGSEQFLGGEVLRQYQPEGRWSHPPCWPEILYTHRYQPEPFAIFGIRREWDSVTGEISESNREVKIIWPDHEVTWWTPREADLEEWNVRRMSTMPVWNVYLPWWRYW